MIKDDQRLRAVLTDAQTNQPTESPALSNADYEQMYHLLYTYRFGSISFLELLDKLETILRINLSEISRQRGSD